MLTPHDIKVIRMICARLAAASVYCLVLPHRAKHRIGRTVTPMTLTQARTVGVVGLVVASAAYVATRF
jgi:hypothetical protein